MTRHSTRTIVTVSLVYARSSCWCLGRSISIYFRHRWRCATVDPDYNGRDIKTCRFEIKVVRMRIWCCASNWHQTQSPRCTLKITIDKKQSHDVKDEVDILGLPTMLRQTTDIRFWRLPMPTTVGSPIQLVLTNPICSLWGGSIPKLQTESSAITFQLYHRGCKFADSLYLRRPGSTAGFITRQMKPTESW